MSKEFDVQKNDENFLQKKVEISNDKAMIVRSPEPLPNEMLKIKKLYIVCFLCIIVGIVFQVLLAVGILGLMIVYTIDDHVVKVKRKVLRTIKFQLAEGIDNDNIFQTTQSIFISKYKMLVEKDEQGNMVLSHDNHLYDIIMNDDNTFTIWWRMSVGKAFLSFNKYKSYRKILASMGIIAYEIQNAYHIQ